MAASEAPAPSPGGDRAGARPMAAKSRSGRVQLNVLVPPTAKEAARAWMRELGEGANIPTPAELAGIAAEADGLRVRAASAEREMLALREAAVAQAARAEAEAARAATAETLAADLRDRVEALEEEASTRQKGISGRLLAALAAFRGR